MPAPSQTQFPQLRSDILDSGDATAVASHLQLTVNPVVQTVQALAAKGVNTVRNLDGDFATYTLAIPATDWTEVLASALMGSWVPFAAVGDSANFAYRKDQAGNVWFRGLLKTGTAPVSNITTLPAWLWPLASHRQATTISAGVESLGRFDVGPNGVVQLQWASGVAAPYTYLIMDTVYPAAKSDPEPLPGFPITVIIAPDRTPKEVSVQVADTSAIPRGQVQRQHAIPYTNASNPSWRYLGTAGGVNRIAIDSIAGLALGRKYNLTFHILYS